MHIDGSEPPNPGEIISAFQSYGVPVYITEFDVNMSNVAGSRSERFQKQADIYKTIIRAALDSGVCRHIDFWDVNDYNSWLDQRRGGNPNADPTLFDDDIHPKPAYFAVRQVLMERLTQK